MSLIGGDIELKLLLEGIEIPVSSARASGGLNSATNAVISIAYTKEATMIKPRTYVVLAYYESYSGRAVASDGSLVADASKSDARLWKELFVGEVLSMSTQTTSTGAVVNYNCGGVWNYLDSAYLYWGGNDLSWKAQRYAVFAGATRVSPPWNKNYVNVHELLPRAIEQSPDSAPGLEGIPAGIVSLCEYALGLKGKGGNQLLPRPKEVGTRAKERDKLRSKSGLNDFLTFNGARLDIPRMIGVPINDRTSEKFFTSVRWKTHFRQISTSMSGMASLTQLVDAIMARAYHRRAGLLCCPYVDNDTTFTKKKAVVTKTSNLGSDYDQLVEQAKKVFKILQRRFDFGRSNPLKDPTSLARTLVKFSQLGTAQNRTTVPTDSTAYVITAEGVFQYDTDNHRLMQQQITATGFPASMQGSKQERLTSSLSQRLQTMKQEGLVNDTRWRNINKGLNLLDYAWDEYIRSIITPSKGGTFTSHTLPVIKSALAWLGNALSFLGSGKFYKTASRDEQVDLGPRLHNYLILPDLYWAPPPTCNTIFPHQVVSVQFSRNWMSEVSRVYLHTRYSDGRQKKDIYFAPNLDMSGYIRFVSSKDKKSGKKVEVPVLGTIEAVKAIVNDEVFIMDHERFTGVVPLIQHVDEAAAIGRINKAVARSVSAQDRSSVLGRAAKDGDKAHLQRAANYYFFSGRFAPRTCRITAQFLPQIVPGMPALVLDQTLASDANVSEIGELSVGPADEEELRSTSQGTQSGKVRHVLGLVADVSHAFTDSSASTSITMVSCRYHDDEDVFNIFESTNSRKKVVTKKYRRKIEPGYEAEFAIRTPDNGAKVYTDGSTAFNPTINKANVAYVVKKYPAENAPRTGFGLQDDGGRSSPSDVPNSPLADLTEVYKPLPGTQVYAKRKSYDPNELAYPDAIINPVDGTQVVPIRGIQTVDSRTASKSQTVSVDAVIVELYEKGTYRKSETVTFRPEDLLTPPWIDSSFYSFNIGDKYYKPTLGCQSVVDVAPIPGLDEGMLSRLTDTTESYTNVSVGDNGEAGTFQIPTEYLRPLKPSIREAADRLAKVWVRLKNRGADLAQYSMAYNARKYTSLPQLLGGNTDLRIQLGAIENVELFQAGMFQYDKAGNPVYGFHASAFGNFWLPRSRLDVKADAASEADAATTSPGRAPNPAYYKLGDVAGNPLIPPDIKPSKRWANRKPVREIVDVRAERYALVLDMLLSLQERKLPNA